MRMQKIVMPLAPSHIPQAASLLARAFSEDPFFTYVLPDTGKRAQVLPWLYERMLRYGLRYGKVHSTPSLEGVAMWLGPKHPSLAFLGTLQTGLFLLPLKLTWPELHRSLRLSNYADQLHKTSATAQHWYLVELGVEPALQGQGVGAALLQSGLAEADQQGLACYLETNNEKNVPLYERNGFSVAGHGQAIPSGPQTWAMIRQPAF